MQDFIRSPLRLHRWLKTDKLLSFFHKEEKKSLSTSYQGQLAAVKEEWSQAVERTRELYTGMLDRVREEHSATLERVTHLKDLELKAAVSASGHVKWGRLQITLLTHTHFLCRFFFFFFPPILNRYILTFSYSFFILSAFFSIFFLRYSVQVDYCFIFSLFSLVSLITCCILSLPKKQT